MTFDPTKNEKPYYFLTEEEREILKGWPGDLVLLNYSGKWVFCKGSRWFLNRVYRAVPLPMTKPSIDWSHVHPDYRWLAMDDDGETYTYKSRPHVGYGYWSSEGDHAHAGAFASYHPGTCDWEDSLVERPEGM